MLPKIVFLKLQNTSQLTDYTGDCCSTCKTVTCYRNRKKMWSHIPKEEWRENRLLCSSACWKRNWNFRLVKNQIKFCSSSFKKFERKRCNFSLWQYHMKIASSFSLPFNYLPGLIWVDIVLSCSESSNLKGQISKIQFPPFHFHLSSRYTGLKVN